MVLFNVTLLVDPGWVQVDRIGHGDRRPLCDMRSWIGLLIMAMVSLLVVVASVVSGGVTLLSVDAGSGSTNGNLGSMTGPAVPLLWRVMEEDAASSCPLVPWPVMGALGFLVSGSGRRALTSPPPWWPAPAGPFGVVSGAGAHEVGLRSVEQAESVLCRGAAATGSVGSALAMITGSAATAQTIVVLADAIGFVPDLAAGRAGVVVFASTALGLPYRWGGNGPGAYDCSGLVVAALGAVGLAFPRTAQEQFDASVPSGSSPRPGDLVFFGTSVTDVSHVGIVIGSGLMIDAPHTGAVVRIESYDWPDLIGRRSAA